MNRPGLLVAVAVLGLAACGDDSKSAATTAGAATAADPAETTNGDSAADTTIGDTTIGDTNASNTADTADTSVNGTADTFPPDSVDPNAPGVGSEFCKVGDELNNSSFDPFVATPVQVQAYYSNEFPDMFVRLQAATPDELKPDVATIGALYEKLITSLKSNGWDMNAAFEDPAVQAAMSGPELDAAGNNLDAYCGL